VIAVARIVKNENELTLYFQQVPSLESALFPENATDYSSVKLENVLGVAVLVSLLSAAPAKLGETHPVPLLQSTTLLFHDIAGMGSSTAFVVERLNKPDSLVVAKLPIFYQRATKGLDQSPVGHLENEWNILREMNSSSLYFPLALDFNSKERFLVLAPFETTLMDYIAENHLDIESRKTLAGLVISSFDEALAAIHKRGITHGIFHHRTFLLRSIQVQLFPFYPTGGLLEKQILFILFAISLSCFRMMKSLRQRLLGIA
jgi:hypothetical protein